MPTLAATHVVDIGWTPTSGQRMINAVPAKPTPAATASIMCLPAIANQTTPGTHAQW